MSLAAIFGILVILNLVFSDQGRATALAALLGILYVVGSGLPFILLFLIFLKHC